MKKYKSYLYLILGCMIVATSFTIFLKPNSFVTGGVSGLSIVINHYFPIDTSLFILIVSIILLIISYFTLGREKTFNSILGSILFPILIKVMELIFNYFPLDIDNLLLMSVFAGVLNGIGIGLVYKAGFTTGGTDIICLIVAKYMKLTIGTSILVTEIIIILLGGLAFGINNLLYALIILILASKISDRVLLGISSNKSFYIVTGEEEKVQEFILHELKNGVTILDAKGSFSKEKKSVLMAVVPTMKYTKLKEGIKEIDKNAFFVVCDAYEVSGGE